MTEEQPEIIVEYPAIFPITGALREVFTERLKTFFQACDTWSCSDDGSLPEKLLKLRREMQESIDYPPVRCTKAVEEDTWGDEMPSVMGEDPEALHVRTLVSPEVRLSWKGLQTRSVEKLPPAVRDAGLDLASRVLGVHIRYGETIFPPDDWQYEPECVAPAKTPPLCPFTGPGAMSDLTKNWNAADRAHLRSQIKKHVAVAAGVALVIGMVLGAVLTPSTVIMPSDGYHRDAYASNTVPHRLYTAPSAIASAPQPAVPQPSQSSQQSKGN